MYFTNLLRLIRVKQWIKNFFVLAPLLFASKFHDGDAILHSFIAMLLFCLASSSAYIVNDIRDIERDRKHPVKSIKRPLASGVVSVAVALVILVIFYIILGISAYFLPQTMMVIFAYLILNLNYSFYLKNMPVLDIFSISIGFVLRVVAGSVALGVAISAWMVLTTLCLALYLASIKRRQELSQRGAVSREVLDRYTVALIDRYAEMSATGALLFYSMFVMSSKPDLAFTVPIVLFGLFRYWYVVDAHDGGESPTDSLYSDWQLLSTISIWVAASVWVLWPH